MYREFKGACICYIVVYNYYILLISLTDVWSIFSDDICMRHLFARGKMSKQLNLYSQVCNL
jgi:hypothetical protein